MKKLLKRFLKFNITDLVVEIRRRKREKRIRLITLTALSDYLKNEYCNKLHLGAGTNNLKGWFNTDLVPQNDIFFLNASDDYPISHSTFQFVYCEHLFEHLTFPQQENLLRESYRILKKNGVLRIATPDIKFLLSLLKEKNEKTFNYVNWSMNHSKELASIKGQLENVVNFNIYVINNFFHAWGHKLIHSKESLSEFGLMCGFSSFKFCEVGESDSQELRGIEKHGTIIPEEMNEMETMIIEFVK